MREKKAPPPYYLDMIKLAEYWNCTSSPRQYHYTFSSNLLAAVREALAQICEEGMLEIWERHDKNIKVFWKKLEEIGLESFVEKVENRFKGVTCVKLPPEVDHREFLEFLRKKYFEAKPVPKNCIACF